MLRSKHSDFFPALRETWLCFAEGDPEPSSGEGDAPPPPASSTPSREDWNKFFGELGNNFNSGNKDVLNSLEKLNETVLSASAKPDPGPSADDIDAMTNSEFGNHLMQRMGDFIRQTFESGIKPINDRLSNLHQEHTISTATTALNELRSAHKDANDWKEEMVKAATSHPTMSIPELYAFVRAVNPKKAAELDGKYNPPEKKPNLFAALPGYGGLNGTGSDNPKPLTKQQAGEEAFKEVSERHPVLAALIGPR